MQVSKRHPSLRTPNRFHSHRVGVAVERDAPFVYNNVLSSSGCIAPYESHSTDENRPCQPPDAALSGPSFSQGCPAAILFVALSPSPDARAAIFDPVVAPSPGPPALVPHPPSIVPSFFPSGPPISRGCLSAIVVSVPSPSLGCFDTMLFAALSISPG